MHAVTPLHSPFFFNDIYSNWLLIGSFIRAFGWPWMAIMITHSVLKYLCLLEPTTKIWFWVIAESRGHFATAWLSCHFLSEWCLWEYHLSEQHLPPASCLVSTIPLPCCRCRFAVAVSPFRCTVAVVPFRSYRCRRAWERNWWKRLSVDAVDEVTRTLIGCPATEERQK